MSIEILTRGYTVMLVVKALLLTLMFSRCAYAIYRNHLEKKVRIVLYGTAIYTLTVGIETWIRAWGRVEQWVCGILPTQSNPEVALIALTISNLGLLAWIMAVEVITHLGISDRKKG